MRTVLRRALTLRKEAVLEAVLVVDADLFVFSEARERYDGEDRIVDEGIVEVM